MKQEAKDYINRYGMLPEEAIKKAEKDCQFMDGFYKGVAEVTKRLKQEVERREHLRRVKALNQREGRNGYQTDV